MFWKGKQEDGWKGRQAGRVTLEFKENEVNHVGLRSNIYFIIRLYKFLTKFPVLSKGGSALCVKRIVLQFFVGYLFKKIIIIFVNIIVLWFFYYFCILPARVVRLLWVYFFCRGNFPFRCNSFSFAVRIFLFLWQFLFGCDNFYFAMRIFLLPWEFFSWKFIYLYRVEIIFKTYKKALESYVASA